MSKAIAKAKVADQEVRWTFINGREVAVSLDNLSDAIVEQAALHGLKQKGSDCYAGYGEKGWSADDCANALEEVLNALRDGEWSRGRSATGGDLTVALHNVGQSQPELLGLDEAPTVEEVIEVVKSLNDKQKRAIKKHPAIARELAVIAARRAEEAAAKADEADGDDGIGLGGLFEEKPQERELPEAV